MSQDARSAASPLERGLPPGLHLPLRYTGKPNPAVRRAAQEALREARLAARRLRRV